MENCLLKTKSTGEVSCLASLVWLTRFKCYQSSMGQQGNSLCSMLIGRTLHDTGDREKKGWVPYHPEELWSSKNFNPFCEFRLFIKKENTTLFQNRSSSHCNKLSSTGLTWSAEFIKAGKCPNGLKLLFLWQFPGYMFENKAWWINGMHLFPVWEEQFLCFLLLYLEWQITVCASSLSNKITLNCFFDLSLQPYKYSYSGSIPPQFLHFIWKYPLRELTEITCSSIFVVFIWNDIHKFSAFQREHLSTGTSLQVSFPLFFLFPLSFPLSLLS